MEWQNWEEVNVGMLLVKLSDVNQDIIGFLHAKLDDGSEVAKMPADGSEGHGVLRAQMELMETRGNKISVNMTTASHIRWLLMSEKLEVSIVSIYNDTKALVEQNASDASFSVMLESHHKCVELVERIAEAMRHKPPYKEGRDSIIKGMGYVADDNEANGRSDNDFLADAFVAQVIVQEQEVVQIAPVVPQPKRQLIPVVQQLTRWQQFTAFCSSVWQRFLNLIGANNPVIPIQPNTNIVSQPPEEGLSLNQIAPMAAQAQQPSAEGEKEHISQSKVFGDEPGWSVQKRTTTGTQQELL